MASLMMCQKFLVNRDYSICSYSMINTIPRAATEAIGRFISLKPQQWLPEVLI